MFDFNRVFISFGIDYSENKFCTPVNFRQFNSLINLPSKPLKGGFWGSEKYYMNDYHSAWHKYIIETLNPKYFESKFNNKSTFFNLKEDSEVLIIKSFEDINITFDENGFKTSSIPLRTIQVSGDVPKSFEKQLYIDFEITSEFFDAIYVSEDFISKVNWILNEYERRINAGEQEYDDTQVTPELVFKSAIFEDWSVGSILILKSKCINFLEKVRL
ncbi:hypothetical protein [Exiguobacterium sp. s133]|uniref:hypothetical protein n=1 Tax=Exiguobacterium sp. s133 TaxID=2751213 RepID=UPI001BED2164|nr:hypothetical protein [Exiguobacterium sp. s133]